MTFCLPPSPPLSLSLSLSLSPTLSAPLSPPLSPSVHMFQLYFSLMLTDRGPLLQVLTPVKSQILVTSFSIFV